MKKTDYLLLFFLSLLAVFIWVRDLTWVSTIDDTLPILVAIPLFIWIGAPWQWREEVSYLSKDRIILVIILFLSGILFNFTLLLTIGWTYLLWSWLKERTLPESHDKIKKLLVLPLMAFPWITLDATRLGWWFRLSGATVTANVFSIAGYDVVQQGTQLYINKLPISVEVACAGLNTLQSMLIAGSVLCFLFLGKTNKYWINLFVLILMAWIANTLRIILLTAAALLISPEFALGAFHTWGGLLVLVVMFGLCWVIFSLQEPKAAKEV